MPHGFPCRGVVTAASPAESQRESRLETNVSPRCVVSEDHAPGPLVRSSIPRCRALSPPPTVDPRGGRALVRGARAAERARRRHARDRRGSAFRQPRPPRREPGPAIPTAGPPSRAPAPRSCERWPRLPVRRVAASWSHALAQGPQPTRGRIPPHDDPDCAFLPHSLSTLHCFIRETGGTAAALPVLATEQPASR